MSQKLQNFKFTRGSAKYAWDKWCDGNVWKLEIGKDFTSKLEIFRAAFSGQCKRKNLRGMTQTNESLRTDSWLRKKRKLLTQSTN